VVWNDIHNSPKYLCLMTDQTIQYCRDPNWGGCPYWAAIITGYMVPDGLKGNMVSQVNV
jgi:hypothetical protein